MTGDELRRLIARNLSSVNERILQASGGKLIPLCCVTKYARDEWVPFLLEAGASHLAENLLPTGAERFEALWEQGYRFTRHLIGAQQSRKLKLVPGRFDMYQAVDREKTAELLNADLLAQGLKLDVLVQVNIGQEEQKHGVAPEEAVDFCGVFRGRWPALRLRGLMAVPPWPQAYPSDDEFERGSRDCFRQMRRLFDTIRASHPGSPEIDTLSLGMSLDFVWAIEEGATMVRVGSALFVGLEG